MVSRTAKATAPAAKSGLIGSIAATPSSRITSAIAPAPAPSSLTPTEGSGISIGMNNRRVRERAREKQETIQEHYENQTYIILQRVICDMADLVHYTFGCGNFFRRSRANN